MITKFSSVQWFLFLKIPISLQPSLYIFYFILFAYLHVCWLAIWFQNSSMYHFSMFHASHHIVPVPATKEEVYFKYWCLQFGNGFPAVIVWRSNSPPPAVRSKLMAEIVKNICSECVMWTIRSQINGRACVLHMFLLLQGVQFCGSLLT